MLALCLFSSGSWHPVCITTYEADLKDGGIIVGVEPRNDEDARYFESEWQREHAHR